MTLTERTDEAFRDIISKYPDYTVQNKRDLWEKLYNGYKEYEELKREGDEILLTAKDE